MASTYAKRLAKLEELLASKLSQALAFIWLEPDESREEACVRAGYDPSMVDRIRFVRWMTEDEAGIAPPAYSWDAREAGPPPDPRLRPDPADAGQTVSRDAQRSEAGATPVAPEPDFEAESRYREAVEQLERDRINEKLFEASKRFAKSIV